MGYLRCKKCEGYYELQKDESPDDYDICPCGGELEYILAPEDMKMREYREEDEYEEEERQKKSNKGLIIAIVIIGVFLLIIFLAIPALLIYRAYFSGPGLDPSTDVDQVRNMRMLVPLFSYYW